MPFDATPQTTDTPASLLIEAARRRIDTEDKWCRRVLSNAKKQMCGMLVTTTDEYVSTVRYLHLAAKERGSDRFWFLNDAPTTTHADVLACMRDGAELARQP